MIGSGDRGCHGRTMAKLNAAVIKIGMPLLLMRVSKSLVEILRRCGVCGLEEVSALDIAGTP